MDFVKQLYFKKKERRAILALLVIIFIIQTYSYWLKPQYLELQEAKGVIDILESKMLIPEPSINNARQWVDSIAPQNKRHVNNKPELNNYSRSITLNPFDPNTADSLELVRLGFKFPGLHNILKYKSRNGFFKQCKDLYKIYGIDTTHLNTILEYCTCNSASQKSLKKKKETKVKPGKEEIKEIVKVKKIININMAGEEEFKTLYGIGDKLSKRIIKYRDNLGGFHSINQITEVYGIDVDIIANNEERIIAEGPLDKININDCTFDDLFRHFYIDYKIARLIINYRKQHGIYESIDQVKEIKLVSDSIYNRIIPYLQAK